MNDPAASNEVSLLQNLRYAPRGNKTPSGGFKGLGSIEETAELMSYLFFEPAFIQVMLDLGYEDGMNAKSRALRFFADA